MVSIIIPAYNEQDAIAETVKGIRDVLEKAGYKDFEIVVVDDGSIDETASRAEEAGARVVRKLQNIGYGHSLKTGINAAVFDTIVICDADGTYPLDQIPALLGTFEKGYHMVVGARAGAHYRESAIKMPLRIILKWLVEFTAGRKIPDINSGLRVFSKKDAMPFFRHLSDSFSFTTSITLAYMLKNMFVEYIPIPYYKRIGKTKVRLFRDSMRMLQYIVLAILYYNPLKIFLVISMAAALIGVACLVTNFVLPTNGALWAGVGAGLVTLVTFAMGLLADLLKQIMDRVDERF